MNRTDFFMLSPLRLRSEMMHLGEWYKLGKQRKAREAGATNSRHVVARLARPKMHYQVAAGTTRDQLVANGVELMRLAHAMHP